MTEKLNLKTDLEVGATSIYVGIEPITGLALYRRFKSLHSDLHEKVHTINYEEWLVAKDGKVYDEFHSIKTYLIVDVIAVPATETTPEVLAYLKYTEWASALSPMLLPSIANRLAVLPVNSINPYVFDGTI